MFYFNNTYKCNYNKVHCFHYILWNIYLNRNRLVEDITPDINLQMYWQLIELYFYFSNIYNCPPCVFSNIYNPSPPNLHPGEA